MLAYYMRVDGHVERRGRVSRAPYRRPSSALLVCTALTIWAPSPTVLEAQTIRGTLLERDSNRPIYLGFVALYTESGDPVDPGNFLLLAAALGHRETTVGVFELGEGGELAVEFRIPLEPLTLDGLLVQADRVGQEPALVLNGFSRRMQQGLGRFITPADIESSPAFRTSDLFVGILGVSVVGDRVQVRTFRGLCTPRIFLDGMPIASNILGSDMDLIVSLEALAAVEVYRRVAEVPLQYGGSQAGCGVILFWTKTGR